MNRAVMKSNRPVHDGETKPDAAGAAIAGISHAIERLKDVRQRRIVHAGTMVTHPDADASGPVATQAHFDTRALASVADGIAHDVFDGAAQQLRIARDDGITALDDLNRPPATLRLERRVVDDLVG